MGHRIVIPRIVVRPILPPPPKIGVRVKSQWLHWQVGRYREKLSFGLGGKGKTKIWVPEIEGEQHNLILDQFYSSLIPQYGFIGSSQYAVVGTGSTAPAATQTGLVAEVARTNNVPSGESNAVNYVSPGVYNIQRVYQFTSAQVGGQNLAEWGFSPLSTAGANLMNRALFEDSSGNATVLTLASDQDLRLIYTYTISLSPTTPQTVTVNISGAVTSSNTAQFMLTGILDAGFEYAGITFSQDQNGADLILCEVLATGTTSDSSNGNLPGAAALASPDAAPLTYLNSSPSFKPATESVPLSFSAVSGNSISASALVGLNNWLTPIQSVFLSEYVYSSDPIASLVFSTQVLTKDNLHQLLVGNWTISWSS
jgi:hypothetical protein